eukprot:303424_1
MNQAQIFNILSKGMSNRNVGATKMNTQSSRSHTIFQITLESRQRETCASFDGSVRCSVLNIVDLAGSERAKKTDATGKRFREGTHINKSLLTLGIVIKKLSDVSRGKAEAGHIPYRDSKLTHILEPALGGNSKTIVICTITPADIHQEESISTLGFASRAKEVKNNATVEEVIDEAAMIRRQRKQIMILQQKLRYYQQNAAGGFVTQRQSFEQIVEDVEMEVSKTMQRESSMQPKRTERKKKSVLGKRRRYSEAFVINGTPPTKRLKTQLFQTLTP